MTGGWWQEVDDRRWISGDGSQETDDNQSPFLYQARKLQSSADMQTYDLPAAWLYRLHAPVQMPNTILNQSQVTQVQCRYRTSRSRLIFGGATIFKEGDDSAGFPTTHTANNYHTGCAGTMHWNAFTNCVGKQWQIHMEKKQQLYSENREKCTQRSDGKRTYRWIKEPHAAVTNPDEIPTQSRRSRLSLSDPHSVSANPTQSRRSQLSFNNPEIHSCYWKSTSEPSLINRYGTRRSHNGLVVCRATIYKRGMTVPEPKSTLTASNHRTGSAGRKYLGAHLPAENHSWRLVDEIWIPKQATASTPGDGAESIPGGKSASTPSN